MYLEKNLASGDTAVQSCIFKGTICKVLRTDNPPFGWKYIAVTNSTPFIENNLPGAEIDGFLCPEQTAQ